MKRIVQKDELGCGIACVAMLTGRTYAATRDRMFPDGRVKPTRTSILRDALVDLGCEVGDGLVPLRTQRYHDFDFDAVLKVNKEGRNWHWVVWDARRRLVLDPLDPPCSNIEAISYLWVVPPA